MSFISRDAGEHVTVLHYSGHDGNFFCCCECLGCVVAILNLCCRGFFFAFVVWNCKNTLSHPAIVCAGGYLRAIRLRAFSCVFCFCNLIA